MKHVVENPKANFFFYKAKSWEPEYRKLRKILLACDLSETLKWGCPCYTVNEQNVALIHGFKDYCAILFMKGVLMNDPNHLLIQQTKNVQAARQLRFTSLREIKEKEKWIKSYVEEAINIERSEMKVPMKKTKEFIVPDELKTKWKENPGLQSAFQSLTPGRQRAYLLHFSSAKQSQTREARIEKYTPHILMGKGLDD